MKCRVEQSENQGEVEIIIKCATVNSKLEELIAYIGLYDFTLCAKRDGEQYQIPLGEILYIESVDERTFLYTLDCVYEHSAKLYQLEEQLIGTDFVRISKSVLLNVKKLAHVRSMINGKYEATLVTREKVIINRHYVNSFKEKFGL